MRTRASDLPHIPGWMSATSSPATRRPRPARSLSPLPRRRAGLSIHLGGDTLTLSWANALTQPPDNVRMRELVDLARQLASALKGA